MKWRRLPGVYQREYDECYCGNRLFDGKYPLCDSSVRSAVRGDLDSHRLGVWDNGWAHALAGRWSDRIDHWQQRAWQFKHAERKVRAHAT
jgi:hypothetical protein